MESSKDPEREKFCLKWNEYENNISATFKALRGDDDFADVTLVSDENLQLEVHKIILAASSPFFSSLLRKNKRDDVHPLIYLRGVKDKELKTVVDFMYHGEVNVYQEDLQDFLTVAEELKLRGLRQEVEDVKDHCANGDAANMGRSFGGENEDDMDEVILHPEQNMTGDTDDIADTEESFVENGRVVVEESDDIEEMIDAMMERGADGDWRCVSCGKTAGKYKNNLRKHVEIVHLDQKGKPCKFCGKTFKSRPNLYAHVRRCQQSPQNQIAEQPSMLGFVPHERTEEDTSYGQMVPMDGTELDVNLMIDPEIEAKVTSLMIRQEATGDWICGECGKNSGKLKANLRKHVEAMHVEGFVLPCASCGRTFGSRNALQCHPCYRQSPHFSTPSIFTHTPGVSTPGFLCEICNKEFKTKQSLKVHKQAIHEGVKFNCEFCSHSATTKSNLKVHVQKKHTIAQPMYEQPLPAGAIQYI